MRVLHVLEATLGGTRRHVIDLLTELTRASDMDDWKFGLVYSSVRADRVFVDSLDSLRARGVALFEIPMVRSVSPVTDLRCAAKLASVIRNWRPDIVHMHSSKAGILGRLAAKLRFAPPRTVYTPHAPAFLFNRAYWLPEALCRPFTDAMIAVSHSEAQKLRSARVIGERLLHTIVLGIPPAPEVTSHDVARIRQRHNISHDAILAVSVGRLSAQKDPIAFLEIAALVCGVSSKVHFCWVGEGELLPQVKARAESLGITERLTLVGFSPEVPAYLAASDMFLLTSRYESFGYVTAEAMAAAKPVIATAVEGTTDLVSDGETGFLIPLGRPKAFADSVLKLASDSSLSLRMGLAGRARVESLFTSGRMAEDHIGLYKAMMISQSEPSRKV